ncbi:SNAP receptor VAM3 Ecym_5410 [Eremothecium cymbalariae DBVPG|uniref:t-SNARE coiled-coil homology domain-containing protein n=1 Tax=Eremothecium cymbalariae (strain CBS 270.75 / DBVPG 7215 / KCTC 17166 / NRRL Y-17582) TaxID=931890 RepID=I6NDM2_ERECY|nr:hypothetical protein Ecym_5410 [Eremothecium cymbalariae DBVPG\
MSFLDLESDPRDSEARSLPSPTPVQDKEIVMLLTAFSKNIQNLQKNVNLLGTSRDQQALRTLIETKEIPLCEELRDTLQSNSKLLSKDKYVSDLQWLSLDLLQLKREYQKRKMDYTLRNKKKSQVGSVSTTLENATLTAVPSNPTTFDETNDNSYVSIQVRPDERTPLLQQQVQAKKQQHVLQDELDFHTLIQEVRNQEITRIHSQVQDVNAIFKQLGTLVQDQGQNVNTIDQNINGLASNLQNANQQLRKADKYQRQRNKCGTLTLCIIAVVTFVVILAIIS